MWFTLFYTPNRYNSSLALQMKGRFYGNFAGAATALGLLRSHVQSSIEGWYLRNDSNGAWVNAA